MYRLLASETSRVLLNGTWKYKIDEEDKGKELDIIMKILIFPAGMYGYTNQLVLNGG